MSAAIAVLIIIVKFIESSNVTDCEKLIWSDAAIVVETISMDQ